MSYLCPRSVRALLLCALGGLIMLPACQQTTPTLVTPGPASDATITSIPAVSPTARADDISITSAEPIATPITAPPPSAAALPDDQPWVLVYDELSDCRLAGSTYRLITISPAGGQLQLDRRVSARAERPGGGAPLLATCALDEVPELLDSTGWSRRALPLPANAGIVRMLLSPDQRLLFFQLSCETDSGCNNSNPDTGRPFAPYQILDLDSWKLQPVPAIILEHAGSPSGSVSSSNLLGWGAAGIYYLETYNKGGGSYLKVVDPYDPYAGPRLLTRNLGRMVDATRDWVAIMSTAAPAASETLYDIERETEQLLEPGGTLSPPTAAPDGSAVAYFRRAAASPGSELVVFDPTQSAKAVFPIGFEEVINTNVALPGMEGLIVSATFWSRDSRRIIALGRTDAGVGEAIQASLITRDGVLLNTVEFPWGELLGVSGDDQLMLKGGFHNTVIWVPLRPGAAPYAAEFGPISGFIIAGYAPALSSVVPPQAAIAPPSLAVTQMPTAAAPTPLPATLAATYQLNQLPYNADLVTDLPLSAYALYHVRGVLYSQPLDGRPLAMLGGMEIEDPLARATPIFVTPDERELIFYQGDGVYRSPLDAGPGERLTPEIADPATGMVWRAAVGPDRHRVVYAMGGNRPDVTFDWQGSGMRWANALYSLPRAGGAPVLLTPPLDAQQVIADFRITPDSQRVIYTLAIPDPSFQPSPNQLFTLRTVALYSVPIVGGIATLLAKDFGDYDPIGRWQLADDGRTVLYSPLSGSGLWSVDVAGGQPTQLSAEYVGESWLSPDQQWLIYVTMNAIFRVPVSGGTAENLSGAAGAEQITGVQRTPDGEQLIFRTRNALYRVAATGGPVTRLANTVPTDNGGIIGLLLGGGHAIYFSEDRFYALGLDGGTLVAITPPLEPRTRLDIEWLSPDARYLIYSIQQEGLPGRRRIMSVAVSGGEPKTLLESNNDGTALHLIGNGYVIGTAHFTLYAVPLAGGPRLQLSEDPVIVRNPAMLSADGGRVIYLARHRGPAAAGQVDLKLALLPTSQ